MRVAVTGASGLIGSALVPALREAGHDVHILVRGTARGPAEIEWSPSAGTINAIALEGVDAIVHLAAENVGQRWSSSVRSEIRDSRVLGTRLVAETAAALDPRPALLCASAVGYYGQQGDEILTERSPRGTGFLPDVIEPWEAAADPARDAGARVVHFRQSPVLAREGGMLERMLLPFRLGLGGRVGNGRQWWSWVALGDVVSAYLFALERPLAGIYNVSAPEPVTSAVFVRELGGALGRPTIFPLPASAVRLIWGEMGEQMLLGGQRVLPEALQAEGFRFEYPELRPALEHVLAG